MSAKLFLSYSHHDRALASEFVDTARSHGVNIWCDERLEGGENWREKIVTELGSAKALVIFFSQHSNQSTQLIKELAIADKLGIRVIPVLVADCEPIGAYLYELASRNWISIWPNPETRLASLVETLASQLDLHSAVPKAIPSATVSPPTPPFLPSQLAPSSPAVAAPPTRPATEATAPPVASRPRDSGRWFPLGRRDLFIALPVMVVAYLLGIIRSGQDKIEGGLLGMTCALVYMLVVARRNAHLNRSVFSKESFASYIVVLLIGMSPLLLIDTSLGGMAAGLAVIIMVSVPLAVVSNILQVLWRRAAQLRKFRSKVLQPLGASSGSAPS